MLIIVECCFQFGGNVGMVVNQSPLALLQLKNIGGAVAHFYRRAIRAYVFAHFHAGGVAYVCSRKHMDIAACNFPTQFHCGHLVKLFAYCSPSRDRTAKRPHVRSRFALRPQRIQHLHVAFKHVVQSYIQSVVGFSDAFFSRKEQ